LVIPKDEELKMLSDEKAGQAPSDNELSFKLRLTRKVCSARPIGRVPLGYSEDESCLLKSDNANTTFFSAEYPLSAYRSLAKLAALIQQHQVNADEDEHHCWNNEIQPQPVVELAMPALLRHRARAEPLQKLQSAARLGKAVEVCLLDNGSKSQGVGL
jgi:hypothetical protein